MEHALQVQGMHAYVACAIKALHKVAGKLVETTFEDDFEEDTCTSFE